MFLEIQPIAISVGRCIMNCSHIHFKKHICVVKDMFLASENYLNCLLV